MKKKSFLKKLASTITAAVCGLTLVFGSGPAPVAEASWLGVLLGTGLQLAVMENQLSYYNGDGRSQFFDKIKSENGVNEDPALNARLSGIMTNLTGAIAQVDPSINDKPYNYFINKDKTFNAFCTVGHNMSVNTGLFDLIQNDDEIAVVLGHEMGHGQKNHVIAGFHRAIPIELAANIAADASGSYLGALVAILGANNLNAKCITKPMEWEADNLAFEYITHSSYNPGACAAIWQRVIEKQGAGSRKNFIGEIFSPSDHPTNKQRRENYEKKLFEYSNGHVHVTEEGMVQVNQKDFIKTADTEAMSGPERAYFVAGSLAAVYHADAAPDDAWLQGDTVMLGNTPILTPVAPEPDAAALRTQLNALLHTPLPAAKGSLRDKAKPEDQTKADKKARAEEKTKAEDKTKPAASQNKAPAADTSGRALNRQEN